MQKEEQKKVLFSEVCLLEEIKKGIKWSEMELRVTKEPKTQRTAPSECDLEKQSREENIVKSRAE